MEAATQSRHHSQEELTSRRGPPVLHIRSPSTATTRTKQAEIDNLLRPSFPKRVINREASAVRRAGEFKAAPRRLGLLKTAHSPTASCWRTEHPAPIGRF